MHIAQLSISNFRGIKTATITFPKHGVIFGPNNTGKTSIMEALALALGREQMAPAVTDWDFMGGDPKPDSRVEIIATITEFGDAAQPDQFPDWFRGERSARPVWWDPERKAVRFEADCPRGCHLAAQIALAIRYDEELCEFETIRYFYDGPGDPFVTEHRVVPTARLQDLGVFLLPSNRQWDRLLTFGSSSFLKMLKSAGAVPGSTIDKVKGELRKPINMIEGDPAIIALIKKAEEELSRFLMLRDSGRLAYRATTLDARAVMQSLMPHILHEDFLLPFSRHGAGMNSLQAFLIILAFADQRKAAGKNFILLAEEPELHLHPALHSRLANRIRSMSEQSLVTTHSPFLASSYKPSEALFVTNAEGIFTATLLREEPVANIKTNAIQKLYLRNREALYGALMGASIIVPEGESDRRWLNLWQRVVESSDLNDLKGPITVIPTQDSHVVDTFTEVRRFRSEALPLVDGDTSGDGHKTKLLDLAEPPVRIVQFDKDVAIEITSAWIIEPCLKAPGPVLAKLFPWKGSILLKDLCEKLCDEKSNTGLQEELAWEAAANSNSIARARGLLDDLYTLSIGGEPSQLSWRKNTISATEIFTPADIVKP